MYVRIVFILLPEHDRGTNSISVYGITEIIHFTQGDRFAWWEAARLKFTRVIKRVVLNQQF